MEGAILSQLTRRKMLRDSLDKIDVLLPQLRIVFPPDPRPQRTVKILVREVDEFLSISKGRRSGGALGNSEQNPEEKEGRVVLQYEKGA